MSEAASTVEPLAEALIIGAGPVGLYQAFQLGLQGIRAHIVDVLPTAGGQCAALYPSKLIHDIPALPPVTGLELTERLLAQIRPFQPTFHLDHEVAAFESIDAAAQPAVALQDPNATPCAEAPRTTFRVTLRPVRRDMPLPDGPGTRHLDVQFVFIAAGVGAFQPKPLRVPGLDAWLGRQVFQHRPDWLVAAVEGHAPWPADRGRHLVVYGADDEALDTVLALRPLAQAQPALRISLVHRREPRVDDIEKLAAFRAACAQGLLHFEMGQPIAARSAQNSPASACASDPTPTGHLGVLQLADADDHVREIPADLVLACQGLSPKLGPLANWGLALDRKQIPVDTARFVTELPGVYAVGDVNTYPGKRKLIACGFHEAVLAGFDAATVLAGAPVPLEYTTSSAKLQRRLGIEKSRPL